MAEERFWSLFGRVITRFRLGSSGGTGVLDFGVVRCSFICNELDIWPERPMRKNMKIAL